MGNIIAFPHNRTITAWQPPALSDKDDAHDCPRCRELEVALKLAAADVARLAKDAWSR